MRFAFSIAFTLAACSTPTPIATSTTPPVARSTPTAPETACCCEFQEGDGVDVETQLQLETRKTCLERDSAACIALDQCGQ